MNKKQASEIVKEMISQHFPEISGKTIQVYFVENADYYMAVNWDLLRYTLLIDKASLQFSEPAFKGCLAHELAHIAILAESNFIGRIRKMFFSKNVTEEERETDYLVVSKKGLGKELLQFHHEHNRNYKSYKASEGLTKREIKKIMKGIEKGEDM